jgi:DDE family transposase
MRLRRVEKFSKAVTKDLLPTQQATIAHVACGMLVAHCMLLAEIARSLETVVEFAHALKRVFRFGNNPRLSARPDPDLLSPELTAQMKVARRTIHSLSRRLRVGPRTRLEIILDWTSCGEFQILSALIGIQGRAVPVLQWSVRTWEFRKSQNAFEYQMLRCVRRCVPHSQPATIVADRGFGRTELFRFLDALGFGYCIRIKGDAWAEFTGHAGPLKDYPVTVGQTFKLPRVRYHKKQRYELKLVLTCARIEGTASTWLLATNLPDQARCIVDLYRRRFWCEEAFRDLKQAFRLEAVRVKTAERLDNLLLVLSIVFFILAIIGVRAEKLGHADKFATRKKGKKVLSWCHLALDLLKKSTKYLDLLFDNRAGVLGYHWA